jgi:YD repeat-containing protein
MNKKNSPQRKTTLKWNANGELSEIDMLRVLERIESYDLNKCELTCDPEQF